MQTPQSPSFTLLYQFIRFHFYLNHTYAHKSPRYVNHTYPHNPPRKITVPPFWRRLTSHFFLCLICLFWATNLCLNEVAIQSNRADTPLCNHVTWCLNVWSGDLQAQKHSMVMHNAKCPYQVSWPGVMKQLLHPLSAPPTFFFFFLGGGGGECWLVWTRFFLSTY